MIRLVSAVVCGNNVVEGDEQCDGGVCCDAQCHFRPSSVVCRASSGPCDLTEQCSGSGSACPANRFQPQGLLCRNASFGPCDVPDYCSATGTCPNSFASDGSACQLTACPSVTGTCISRQCLGDCQPPVPVSRCGDGQCGSGEDCKSCPEDCAHGLRYCCAYWGCAGRACPTSAEGVQSLCRSDPLLNLRLSSVCLFGECQ